MRGGWHPAVQRRNGHAEVLGHVLGRHPAGQQLLGRLDLAVGHLRLAAAFAAELLGDFQPGAGALDGQLALHFGKARHDVEEEPPGWCAGVDGVGEAPELDTVLVQLADQIDQLLDRPAQPVELQTTKVSPSRSISSVLAKPGRSARVPLSLSSKTFYIRPCSRLRVAAPRF